jgi:hypothetical protein
MPWAMPPTARGSCKVLAGTLGLAPGGTGAAGGSAAGDNPPVDSSLDVPQDDLLPDDAPPEDPAAPRRPWIRRRARMRKIFSRFTTRKIPNCWN